MSNATNQSIGTFDIVRHFWKRLWVLLILPPIFLVLSYLYVVNFMGEAYESSAMLMVRTPASSMRQGSALERLEPPVYKDFLASDELIHDVLTAAREKFPNFPQSGFENQRSSFTVNSVMTRDTSVQAEYSPVLELNVKWNSPEMAKFLLDEWLSQIFERFGSLRTREAEEMRDTTKARYDELAASVLKLQESETRLEQSAAEVKMMLDSDWALLTGTSKKQAGSFEDKSREPISLLAEQVRLQLELAELSESDEQAPRLKARLAKVESLIAEMRENIEELGKKKVQITTELEKVRNDLISDRGQMVEMRSVFTAVTIDATSLSDPANPEIEGDLLLLSRPVLPEVRVAPPRAAIALGITAFLTALLATVILLELYLRRAVLGRA